MVPRRRGSYAFNGLSVILQQQQWNGTKSRCAFKLYPDGKQWHVYFHFIGFWMDDYCHCTHASSHEIKFVLTDNTIHFQNTWSKMDHLTNLLPYPFICARKVSVSDFIESWKESLDEELSLAACTNHNERNASDLNIPVQMVKSLQKDLHPDSFCSSIEDEKLLAENLPSVAATLKLETLKQLCEYNEAVLNDSHCRLLNSCKYRHELQKNWPTTSATYRSVV